MDAIAGDPPALSRQAAQRSCDAQVAATLRPLLVVAAALLLVYALVAPWMLPSSQAVLVGVAEAVLAVCFLGAAWLLSRKEAAVRWVHPIFAFAATGALASNLITYYTTRDPLLTTGVILLIIGIGIIVLSWTWLAIILSITVGGWLAVLFAAGAPDVWKQLVLIVGASVMLSSMAHAARLRTHLKLAALREHDAQQYRALSAAEQRLRSVVRAAPVILLATDAEGRVVLAEGKGLESRGWNGANVVGRFAQEFLLPTPGEASGLALALSGAPSMGTTEREGSTFETFWTPVEDGARVVGAICVATDVTERVRAEQEARKAAEQGSAIERLQEMDRFKTLILNTASHELNTPLTPIKIQMHMLKLDAARLDARQQRAVAVLDRNFERLSALVGDILDVARLQGKNLRLTPASIDLTTVVEEACGSYASVAAEKGLALEVDARESAPLQADARRLLQVLFNLLSNATKFTPSGGSIHVLVRHDAGAAVVEVRDTGAGLTPDQQSRLFAPFSQVHDTMRADVGGTGLGLYISRGIAEQHGGTLTCASDGPGRGSTFTLRLPIG